MSFWEIASFQDSTLSELAQTVGLMLSENRIIFDPKSRRFAPSQPSGILSGGDSLCANCQGKGVIPETRFKEALDRFLDLTTDRPPPIAEYNQGVIAPTDLALKSVFMYHRGDLEGRSVLLIGDDDLFSLFLSLLDLRCSLTVLEIDGRLIRYLKQKMKGSGLSITARKYDVTAPLPRELRGTFDTFVTEPPEGLRGMRAFLGKAVDALNATGSGYFGLTTLESSLSKWLAIQKFLMEKGMVITDLLRNFSLYPEAGDPIRDYDEFPITEKLPVAAGPPDVDYFRSSLIRVEKTSLAKMEEDEGFYTDKDTWVTVNPEEKQ